jgi:hypothetical protein
MFKLFQFDSSVSTFQQHRLKALLKRSQSKYSTEVIPLKRFKNSLNIFGVPSFPLMCEHFTPYGVWVSIAPKN